MCTFWETWNAREGLNEGSRVLCGKRGASGHFGV